MTRTNDGPLCRGGVRAYLARYGTGTVSLGDVLCDVHADGDSTALVCEGATTTGRITYRDLAEGSRRLAGALADSGVGGGDRVAVLLPKSPELRPLWWRSGVSALFTYRCSRRLAPTR